MYARGAKISRENYSADSHTDTKRGDDANNNFHSSMMMMII